jgi:nitrate reductase gamma subunit
MDLLDFARGPALSIAVAVFVLGSAWRLIVVARRPRMPDLSPPREGAPSNATSAVGAVMRGLWPHKGVSKAHRAMALNAYVYHVGMALVVFGYAPHIDFVRRHLGLGWPALPDVVMYVAAGVSFVSLLLALAFRLSDPVRRLISNADDWISWTLTFLPFITGMAVLVEPSAQILARGHTLYRGPLAVHLLAFLFLLVWFPFGKLMHAVFFAFSRGATGVRFGHRGVRV